MNEHNNDSIDITSYTKHELNQLDELDYAQYTVWRDALPDSPVPSGLRLAVRGLYSLQLLRISLGNQVIAQFRSKLGIPPSTKEDAEGVDTKAKQVLDTLRKHYERITEGVPEMLTQRKFKADGVFSDYAEFILADTFLTLWSREVTGFARLESSLNKIPVYVNFLEKVPGCGKAMSGFLLSELNPYRARWASSFCKYLGLDIASDGTGRSCKKLHHEPGWVRRKQGGGYVMKKEMIKTHNPASKSKVMGVLADCLIKSGLTWMEVTEEDWDCTPEPFRRIHDIVDKETKKKRKDVKQVAIIKSNYVEYYLNYKHRKQHSVETVPGYRKVDEEKTILTHVRWCDTTPSHRDRAAKRAMIKLFLYDFWEAWRIEEGLPVGQSYAESFLGRSRHHDRRDERRSA